MLWSFESKISNFEIDVKLSHQKTKINSLSVEQQGVNENQVAEMAQVRQTITNEMWKNYRRS